MFNPKKIIVAGVYKNRLCNNNSIPAPILINMHVHSNLRVTFERRSFRVSYRKV